MPRSGSSGAFWSEFGARRRRTRRPRRTRRSAGANSTWSLMVGFALFTRMPTFGASDSRVVAGFAPVPAWNVRPPASPAACEGCPGVRVAREDDASGRHRAAACDERVLGDLAVHTVAQQVEDGLFVTDASELDRVPVSGAIGDTAVKSADRGDERGRRREGAPRSGPRRCRLPTSARGSIHPEVRTAG